MTQTIPKHESKSCNCTPEEFERVCQKAAHDAIVRNARLGFPAVGMENGTITFWPPERVLAEFAKEVVPPIANSTN